MQVIGLCGSLRAASLNAVLLRACARLAPADMRIEISACPGALPLFNPDLEGDPPTVVRQFRAELARADALLIASPEYAHGLTGVIKNALDWLVSFEPVAGLPVAVLNASPRARHANAALREVLETMSLVILEQASVTVPLVGSGLTEEAMLASPAIAQALREGLAALAAHRREPGDPRAFAI